MSKSLGFHNLPYLVHRKSMKKGFRFSVIVVGESGLGKSTLIQSLFGSDINSGTINHLSSRIDTTTVEIEPFVEKGVKLKLTVVDTPGFGDDVDNTDCWVPIVQYITSKYDKYLDDENSFNRPNIEDDRVHCCLYFISPNSHNLKALDIECMKQLHHIVNIIPVIAKADTLTETELKKQKTRILKEIAANEIHIYNGEIDQSEDSYEIKEIMDAIPMGVIGSTTFHQVGSKRVRGRLYPWGLVEVDSKEHSDFVLLQKMLLNTHMQDLKDCTNDIHYENYRKTKLANVPLPGRTIYDDLIQAKEDELEEMRRQMARLQAQLSKT